MPLSELEQVNAIVGLSMRIAGWPSTLADLGYSLDRIEIKFKIPDQTQPGRSIEINPDLLFVQDRRNCSLITELKSGRFQGFEQLNRFLAVKPIELVRYGGVVLQDISKLPQHRIGVLQIVNSEFSQEYDDEFSREGHAATLISIDKEAISHLHGTLPDAVADRELKKGVSLTGYKIPTKLIPVLPTTNDEYEIVKRVAYSVRDLWVNNARFVTTDLVVSNTYKQIWDCFGKEAQDRFTKVVHSTVKDMHETEFYGYLRPFASERDKWALLNLPNSIEEKQRTREFQKLNQIVGEYTQRRLHKKAYSTRRAGQPSLLDLDEMQQELTNKKH